MTREWQRTGRTTGALLAACIWSIACGHVAADGSEAATGIDAGADGQGPGVPPPPPCYSDDECIALNGDRAARCILGSGLCVFLGTPSCTVSGNFRDRNAIFIGELTSNTAPDPDRAETSKIQSSGFALALEELATKLPGGGLVGGVNGARRPIVRVTCETRDAQGPWSRELVEHLALDVQISALVTHTSRASTEALAVGAKFGRPLFVTCTGCDLDLRKAMQGIGDPALIYQLQAPEAAFGKGVALEVAEIAAAIRAEPGFPGGEVGVALFARPSAGLGPTIGDRIRATLPVSSSTLSIDYDGTTPMPPELVTPVVSAKSRIVVIGGGDEAQTSIIPMLEAAWPDDAPRPRYVVTNPAGLTSMVVTNDDLRQRIVGLSPRLGEPRDAARSAAFIAYKEKIAARVGLEAFSASGYEAGYLLPFAIVAAGAVPNGYPTAYDVAAGLRKLHEGTSYTVGSADVMPGMSDLLNAGEIDLAGLTSSLNFDSALGWSPTEAPVFCIGKDSATGAPVLETATGQSYDPVLETLKGTFHCP